MATAVAATRYVGTGDLDSINSSDGNLSSYTVLISTADTGVYVGPQSMGTGSSFPATVDASHAIGGYPLTPNKEYCFNVVVIGGSQTADNAGLYVTTVNTSGSVVSYLVLEKE